MQPSDYSEALREILEQDPRYAADAYHFLRETLDFAIRQTQASEGAPRHISGQELLESIRVFALQEFGPMAFTVLRTWGIHCTEDFGHIVFNLVKAGILGKTEQDSIDDFKGGYDFQTAFVTPFQPEHPLPGDKKPATPLNHERPGTSQ
jgi:uncharacterized repeat protein (TIGR04138 family)